MYLLGRIVWGQLAGTGFSLFTTRVFKDPRPQVPKLKSFYWLSHVPLNHFPGPIVDVSVLSTVTWSLSLKLCRFSSGKKKNSVKHYHYLADKFLKSLEALKSSQNLEMSDKRLWINIPFLWKVSSGHSVWPGTSYLKTPDKYPYPKCLGSEACLISRY